MKNTKNKMIAIAVLLVAFSANSFAQSSATNSVATAAANIVTPIAITNSASIIFGNVVASAAGGTVILGTDASLTPSGVTLLSGITATAAEFTVTGDANFTYYVTLPGNSDVVLAKSGAPSMTLTDFTENSTGALTGGTENFKVGAKLHVGANQIAGSYISTGFDVTVTYN
jgi:hypothetical protein